MKKLSLVLLLVGCAHVSRELPRDEVIVPHYESAYASSGRMPGSMVVKTLLGQPTPVGGQGSDVSFANGTFLDSVCVARVPGSTFGCITARPDSNWIYLAGSPSGTTSAGWRIMGTGTNGYGLYLDTGGIYTGGDVTAGNIYATGLRGNTGVSNLINLHAAAGINLYAQASGTVTVSVGTSGSVTGHVASVPNADSTGVGNVGASGPDDLQTYTLPAGGLAISGFCVRITAKGTIANTANAKTVRLVAGASPTVLVSKQLPVSVAGRWEMHATICRTGANAQDFFADAESYNGTAVCATAACTDGATIIRQANNGTMTETESGTIPIKVQSTTSTANNDIVSELLLVEHL